MMNTLPRQAGYMHEWNHLIHNYFGLKLSYLVFSAAEQFSVNLQAKNITIQEATRGAVSLASHLKSLRTEAEFNQFYEQVVAQSSTLTEEPKLPRNRKMLRRYDDGKLPHQYAEHKDKYRHTYFEIGTSHW